MFRNDSCMSKEMFLCGFKGLEHKAVFVSLRMLQLVTTIVFSKQEIACSDGGGGR